MTSSEYNQAIIKLLKASAIEEINKLDYKLIKSAIVNINDLDDEEDGDDETATIVSPVIAPPKKIVAPISIPEIEPIPTARERIREMRAKPPLQPSDPPHPSIDYISTVVDKNKRKIKEPVENVKQIQFRANELQEIYLDVTQNWGTKGRLEPLDIQNLMNEIKAKDNGDSKAILKDYEAWLNTDYIKVMQAKYDEQAEPKDESIISNANTVKDRLCTAIINYRLQIANKGFGYNNGVKNKATYTEMLDLYQGVTLLLAVNAIINPPPPPPEQDPNSTEKVKRPPPLIPTPRAFFKNDVTPEVLDMFTRAYFFQPGNENEEAVNIINQNKEQKAINQKRIIQSKRDEWLDQFLKPNDPTVKDDEATLMNKLQKLKSFLQKCNNIITHSDEPVTDEQMKVILDLYIQTQSTRENANKGKLQMGGVGAKPKKEPKPKGEATPKSTINTNLGPVDDSLYGTPNPLDNAPDAIKHFNDFQKTQSENASAAPESTEPTAISPEPEPPLQISKPILKLTDKAVDKCLSALDSISSKYKVYQSISVANNIFIAKQMKHRLVNYIEAIKSKYENLELTTYQICLSVMDVLTKLKDLILARTIDQPWIPEDRKTEQNLITVRTNYINIIDRTYTLIVQDMS